MSNQDADRSVSTRTALLEEALRRARSSQAELLDARANVSDLRFLRLDALADEMRKITQGQPHLDVFMTLKAVPGDPPRYIVDANSHVVMEPDPRTYMLIYDGPQERKVLCETDDRREMEQKLTDYVANRIVEQERATGSLSTSPEITNKNSKLSYAIVFALGALLGILAVLAFLHQHSLLPLEIFQALTKR